MPVTTYNGFKEFAYRLLMPYETNFPTSPFLQTIRKDGTVETEKVLEPQPERGILTYPYLQEIDYSKCMQFLNTPYIYQYNNSYLLAQLWPTKYNDSFKQSYTIYTTNPDPNKYSEEAVEIFKTTCNKLFQDATAGDRVLYCCKESVNTNRVYVGTCVELIEFLRTNSTITMGELNISSVFDNGFVSNVVDGKGRHTTKKFTITDYPENNTTQFVIYTKQGWETMACTNSLEDFLVDREVM